MNKIIALLKKHGFKKMDSCIYANDKGICFCLNPESIIIINGSGATLEEFSNVKYNIDTEYLIIGFLWVKNMLVENT